MSNSTNSENGSGKGQNAKPVAKPPRFGYIELGIFMGLWLVMIVAFKVYSRSRKAKKASWFPPNEERAEYERMLMTDPQNEEALKKQLLRRCMTDVRRLLSLQEERDSIMSLSRTGAIGEEMSLAFKAAEKDLELELFEVQAEAETFKAGWGQEIIKDAVRLSKIEDELMEVKKRKEREDRRKEEEAAQKEKDKKRAEKQLIKDEEEKKKILEELLQDQAESEVSSPKDKDSLKAKKRLSAGPKKKVEVTEQL